jgi:hypothetical protein
MQQRFKLLGEFAKRLALLGELAHGLTKIENLQFGLRQVFLGEKVSTKPVEVVTPFPCVKERAGR